MRRFITILVFIFAGTFVSFSQDQRNMSYPRFQKGEIIIRHSGHTLSYNPDALIPNWVAYTLKSSNLEGDAQRASSFSVDPAPQLKGFKLAEHWNYTHSGWVRGHMAPAGDFKYNQAAMNDTFYTTNICPMNMSFNNGIWKRLEEKARRLAQEHSHIYIITGPVIGSNKNGKVGESDILVPDAFYKALLVPVNGSYLAIGFYMVNEPAPKGAKLRDYAITLKQLEDITGRIFFASLNRKTSSKIKNELPLKELGLF